jgi:hypothetical protein
MVFPPDAGGSYITGICELLAEVRANDALATSAYQSFTAKDR